MGLDSEKSGFESQGHLLAMSPCERTQPLLVSASGPAKMGTRLRPHRAVTKMK